MRIRNQQNLVGGVGLVSIALLLWLQLTRLPLIHGTSLGSGGLPKICAVAVGLFGVWFCISAVFVDAGKVQPIATRGIFAILAAVLVFALGLERLGLFASGTLAAFLAGMGASDRRLAELIAFSILVSAACTLVFVRLLGIPVPVWPTL
jgi:hypothetical protein